MGMFRIYLDRLNDIREYYYSIGEDMSENQVREYLKSEIKEFGVYDGDNIMWTSPDNKYKFLIKREPAEFYIYATNSEYIITIKVVDAILGIPITEFRINEFSCVDILSKISLFPENYYCTGDTEVIYLNPNNRLEGHIIYLTNIGEEDKDILFEIKQSSSVYNNIITLVTLKLSMEELADLCFYLFFECIIDLDIPEYLTNEMENIEDFILCKPKCTPNLKENMYTSIPIGVCNENCMIENTIPNNDTKIDNSRSNIQVRLTKNGKTIIV